MRRTVDRDGLRAAGRLEGGGRLRATRPELSAGAPFIHARGRPGEGPAYAGGTPSSATERGVETNPLPRPRLERDRLRVLRPGPQQSQPAESSLRHLYIGIDGQAERCNGASPGDSEPTHMDVG